MRTLPQDGGETYSPHRRLLAPLGREHRSAPAASLLGPEPCLLSYGADRRLLEGSRLMADFDRCDDGSFGRISAFGSCCEISRPAGHGWGFCLEQAEVGERLCEYLPFRIGRGGYVVGRDAHAMLCGVPLHPHRWSFLGEGGWTGAIRASGHGATRELTIKAARPLPVTAPTAVVLALCCWLVVEWETISLPGGGG